MKTNVLEIPSKTVARIGRHEVLARLNTQVEEAVAAAKATSAGQTPTRAGVVRQPDDSVAPARVRFAYD